MRIRVEDCDDAAFAKIAPMLREDDQNEWRMFAGGDAPTLIRDHGFKLSEGAGTINRIGYLGSNPVVAWGASPAPNFGTPHEAVPGWVWLVATPEAVPVAKSIHRHLAVEFGRIVAMYPEAGLVTYSWDQNKVHHQWLEWLGFKRGKRNLLVPSTGGIFIPFTFKV